jgi:predicted amidohydrolase YtcJ
MSYLQRILGERAQNLIPLRSMLAHGLTIAGGSDAPCTLPDPILGIHAACNHPNPDEKIPVIDALRMHTSWAARLSFDEDDRGTLETGKVADFIILDRNPLSIPVETLKEINMEGLYIGGQPYSRSIRRPLDLALAAIKNIVIPAR